MQLPSDEMIFKANEKFPLIRFVDAVVCMRISALPYQWPFHTI